jgi:hypothetical protein
LWLGQHNKGGEPQLPQGCSHCRSTRPRWVAAPTAAAREAPGTWRRRKAASRQTAGPRSTRQPKLFLREDVGESLLGMVCVQQKGNEPPRTCRLIG